MKGQVLSIFLDTWNWDKDKDFDIHCHIIQICSGITSGRVLDGELLYTKILEVNLFAFDWREVFMKQSVGKCNKLTSRIFVDIHCP